MTPEQLDLIKRLQPFFKKMMGEWRHLDSCYCDKLGVGVVMGSFWRVEFHFHNRNAYTMEENVGKISCLRIPKAIDLQNPERGLWGMLNTRTVIEIRNSKTIVKQNWGYSSIWDSRLDAPDPFTALLKALAKQEGV